MRCSTTLPLIALLATLIGAGCSDAGDAAKAPDAQSEPAATLGDARPFATSACPLMGPPTIVRYQRVKDGERIYNVHLYNDHRDRVSRSGCEQVQPLSSSVLLSYRIAS